MRKLFLFSTLLMLCGGMWAQSITLQFTGQDASNHRVQLDRVIVTNLSQNWQETIYWPDTTLTLGSADGIDDYANNGGFDLSQNNPNPFNGTTDILLTVADAGAVTLEITDVNGRMVVETWCTASLPYGTHQLRVTLSAAGTYVMTARQNGKTSSIKMVNNGGGNDNGIEYAGEIVKTTHALSQQPKSYTRGTTTNPFNFGDQMEYVGYATINGTERESQHIEQIQDSSQTFILQFSVSQQSVPTVSTSEVIGITGTTATCGGDVTSNGSFYVHTRGVCWSIFPTPTTNGINCSHTSNGSGIGSFTSELTGLTGSTTYYVRAYAINNVGTGYGEEMTFTTSSTVPTVRTDDINNITDSSAICGGDVLRDGGEYVTARGVCWSTSPNPTIEDVHTTDSIGIGSFNSVITGLTGGTQYYVRAYATNNVGTGYGSEVIFTAINMPTIITTIDGVSYNGAILTSNVISDGGAEVIERGICWSTTPNPTPNNAHIAEGGGLGDFTSFLSGLAYNTTYYVRAYAFNCEWAAYSNEVTFTTLAMTGACPEVPTVRDRDGNVYNTVKVGNQCWMKENLRTTKYADGTTIPQDYGTYAVIASWNYPKDMASYKPMYGLLYNWPAVMRNSSSSSSNPSGVQGICPTGWHVPSYAEWTQLTNYVNSQSQYICNGIDGNIAKALSNNIGWHSSTGNVCAVGNPNSDNNSTGFSAMPAGYSDRTSISHLGECAGYWSSTYATTDRAYRIKINHYLPSVDNQSDYQRYYFSVRCLKD